MFCYCPPEILANHRCFIPDSPINYSILKHEEFYSHALVKTWVYALSFFSAYQLMLWGKVHLQCIPLLIRNRTYQIRCIKLSRDEKNMIFGQKLSKLRVLTCNNYRVVSCYLYTTTGPTKNTHDKIFAYQSVITSLQYFSIFFEHLNCL